nr:phage portal protein [Gordonibacter massiliensis (ex Traore et al. 2017)]
MAVTGLTDGELADLNALLSVWWRKRERNVVRERYYNAHNRLKDLGISIPPPLKRIETVVEWPEKAVDYIADRAVLEGFTFRGMEENDELNEVMDENDFLATYSQAVTDALISSCAFLTVTKGVKGEPSVIVSAHSARDAAAIWDDRKKRIKCGLAVAEFDLDRDGRIKGALRMNMFTDSCVLSLRKARNGRYVLERRAEHSQGAPLMEAIRCKPRLGRPFGKSRISRAVMSISDSAVREALRSEVSAEFFTAPQKYILGAEDSIFDDKGKWEQYVGNWLALTKDEEGDVPQVGQFSQGNMQSHSDYMRLLAARFSGATGIPVSSLGVIHDNPSSAEAIYASKEDAVVEAANFNRANRSSLVRVAKLMLAVSRGKSVADLSDDEKTVRPRFMNPSMPSIVSQSDAMVKQIDAIPWIGESRVALEQLGYDETQIMTLLSDKRKAESRALLQTQQQQPDNSATMYEIASILKSFKSGKVTRKNAVALFARIGIDADEAEQMLDDADDASETVDAVAGAVGGAGDDIAGAGV